MDELPYALSEEDFVRMSNAVRRVEGLPPRRDSQAIYRAAPEGNAHNWIKVTSATGSTVTLGGGTVTGYAAVWGYFDASGTGFTWTTNAAWFVPAPGGGTPAVNQVFECRLLGADTSGVPIWGAVIPPALSLSHIRATLSGSFSITADTTYHDTGLNISVTANLTYFITCQARCSAQWPSTKFGGIYVSLTADLTNWTNNPFAQGAWFNNFTASEIDFAHTVTMVGVLTVGNNNDIVRLKAAADNTGLTNATVATSPGLYVTEINAVQIG